VRQKFDNKAVAWKNLKLKDLRVKYRVTWAEIGVPGAELLDQEALGASGCAVEQGQLDTQVQLTE